MALPMAEGELAEVLCWCPDLYPQALQIKLSLILAAMAPSPAGAVLPPAGDAGKVAYVTEDSVGDVTRKYTLADLAAQQKASTPAGLLAGMIERCRAPLRSGAVLARSVMRGRCGCAADKAEPEHGY